MRCCCFYERYRPAVALSGGSHPSPIKSKFRQKKRAKVRTITPALRASAQSSSLFRASEATRLPVGQHRAVRVSALKATEPWKATRAQCATTRTVVAIAVSPTLRQAWPRDGPGAAICVQDVDVQCVLQFTLSNAAGCALHRRTSRVIPRLEL